VNHRVPFAGNRFTAAGALSMDRHEEQEQHDHGGYPEQPDDVTPAVDPVSAQLALPGRDSAMRHMGFAGMPADKACKCRRYYDYFHGQPRIS
jgi:hypothetical protein